MKKAVLPLFVASLIPAVSFADVTVYGRANVSFQNSDVKGADSYTELVSNSSRIGLKGGDAISDGIKAIYQFEYETRLDDGSFAQTCTATSTTTAPATTKTTCSVSGQTFAPRNIYVGLQGTGGTVILGMFDTPLKSAQEKVDLFNDLAGDLKWSLQGETRAKNIIQYATPDFNNITATIAYVNAETGAPGTDNGYSASVAYNTKTMFIALANDHNVSNAIAKTAVTHNTDVVRLVGRFNLGPVVLGGLLESYDNGTVDENGFLLSAQWNINSQWALKAQTAQSDMNALGRKTSSIGVDYKLSKATKIFSYYSINKDDVINDNKYLGVGLELNF